MIRSSKHRVGALVMASAALLVGAGTTAASAPIIDSLTRHVERPFVDCPGFSTLGVWDFETRLTLFVDSSGTPIRDIEQLDYSGRIVNTSTGAPVPGLDARRPRGRGRALGDLVRD